MSMPRDRFLSQTPDLLDWYARLDRDLPWRRKSPPDPYETWISEVMSQQSTMASVLPYFDRWMKRFPNLETLASAPQEEVLKAWTGLGYYSRARNVLKAAQALQEFRLRERRWPQTASEWQSFAGIGPYTAAAVASIAFGDAVLPVDGNVIRVLSRFAKVPDPLNKNSDKAQILKISEDISRALPKGSHGKVAQALMDLGSQICRPKALAQCRSCPLSEGCEAALEGAAADYPRSKNRPETEKVLLLAPIYRTPRGRGILLRKIPEGRRLAGHWELPNWELGIAEKSELIPKISKKFQVLGPVKHQILNRAFEAYAVESGTWSEALPEGHALWSPESDAPAPLTTLTRKLFKVLQSAE